MAQTVKNLPEMWETWVCSLGQEDPLEKGMATYSSILTWRIPWTEEPIHGILFFFPQAFLRYNQRLTLCKLKVYSIKGYGLQSTGSRRVGYD